MHIRIFVRNLVIVPIMLAIPAIAMYAGMDVHWSTADFIIAALLLSIVRSAMTLCMQPANGARWQWWVAASLIVLCAVIWVELAVGLVGTPWAGS